MKIYVILRKYDDYHRVYLGAYKNKYRAEHIKNVLSERSPHTEYEVKEDEMFEE